MGRSYEIRFVCSGTGEVVDVIGHGNIRKTAERSARMQFVRRGLNSRNFYVRSCKPIHPGGAL